MSGLWNECNNCGISTNYFLWFNADKATRKWIAQNHLPQWWLEGDISRWRLKMSQYFCQCFVSYSNSYVFPYYCIHFCQRPSFSLNFTITNSFQYFLSLTVSCVCLLCICIVSIVSIRFYSLCLHEKKLVLLDLINKSVTSTIKKLLKSKDIVELCKVNFWYQWIMIQCNSKSCCEHVKGGVNIIFIWVSQSLDPCLCCVSLLICVCVVILLVPNHGTSNKTTLYVRPQ